MLDPVHSQRMISRALVLCSRAKQWEYAVAMFKHMMASNKVTPNLVNYETLITLLGEAGQWAMGMYFLDEARALGLTRSTSLACLLRILPPDVFATFAPWLYRQWYTAGEVSHR